MDQAECARTEAHCSNYRDFEETLGIIIELLKSNREHGFLKILVCGQAQGAKILQSTLTHPDFVI